MATRSKPRVLETKGKERETLTLHSITFSWSSWRKEEQRDHDVLFQNTCRFQTGPKPGGRSFQNMSHLGDELQVERSSDLELLSNGVHDHLDRLHRLLVEVLGWRHQRGVSGVDASVLHVL